MRTAESVLFTCCPPAPLALVERAQAHEPVDAALGLQDPVRVLAAHREGRRLEAGLLPGARLEQVALEAAVLRPAEIHAQQDLGPVLGVSAAGAGVDRDERVTRVVLAGEERVLLQPVELVAERRDARRDLVLHLAVHREQLLGVLVVLEQPAVAVEPARQARVLGADLRRMLLIVPESRRGQLLLELGHPALELIRVKGNHGPRRAGPRSPGAAGRAGLRVPGRPWTGTIVAGSANRPEGPCHGDSPSDVSLRHASLPLGLVCRRVQAEPDKAEGLSPGRGGNGRGRGAARAY